MHRYIVQLHCTYDCIVRRTNDSPKINFEIYLILKFLRWRLEIGGYVLGTKTELSIEQIFDLGHRLIEVDIYRILKMSILPKNIKSRVFEMSKFDKIIPLK